MSRAPALLLWAALASGFASGLAPVSARGQGAPAPPVTGPRTLLREAIDLYVVGKYREAAERLRPVVESQVLLDVADQKEALRTFGISLYLSDARPAAERAFRALLLFDPAERLDPSYVRPEVVSFFEATRQRYRGEIDEIVRQRRPRYNAANLLPPWGQFQNGHRKKGYWVLGGELGFGAASIVTASLLYAWRDKHNQFDDHEAAAEVLQPLNWALFATTAAVIIYGIVDGYYHYYRQRRTLRPVARSISPRTLMFAQQPGLTF